MYIVLEGICLRKQCCFLSLVKGKMTRESTESLKIPPEGQLLKFPTLNEGVEWGERRDRGVVGDAGLGGTVTERI
jgi:hypothetical protein